MLAENYAMQTQDGFETHSCAFDLEYISQQGSLAGICQCPQHDELARCDGSIYKNRQCMREKFLAIFFLKKHSCSALYLFFDHLQAIWRQIITCRSAVKMEIQQLMEHCTVTRFHCTLCSCKGIIVCKRKQCAGIFIKCFLAPRLNSEFPWSNSGAGAAIVLVLLSTSTPKFP